MIAYPASGYQLYAIRYLIIKNTTDLDFIVTFNNESNKLTFDFPSISKTAKASIESSNEVYVGNVAPNAYIGKITVYLKNVKSVQQSVQCTIVLEPQFTKADSTGYVNLWFTIATIEPITCSNSLNPKIKYTVFASDAWNYTLINVTGQSVD